MSSLLVGFVLTCWQTHGLRHYFQIQDDLGVNADAFGYPIPDDSDRAQWAVLTDHARKHGDWRVKWLEKDNYPDGSGIYWSSSFVWLGRLHAQLWALVQGVEEDTRAVYWAGTFIAPLLGIFGGMLVFAAGACVFGILPSLMITALLVLGPRSEVYFGPGAWDHHGLIKILTFTFVLGSYKVVSQLRKGGDSRGWVFLSAASCALCYWLGVLSFAPVFAAVWVGLVICCFPLAKMGTSTYGRMGIFWISVFGGMAGVLYLAEFPDATLHLRSEALNPSVIVSVIGSMLCLEWLIRKISGRDGNILLIAGVSMASVFPLIILVGGEAFYSPADPEFARFLQLVRECKPTESGLFALYLPLWAAGIVACGAVIPKCSRRCELFILITPAVTVLLMGFFVARWYSTGALLVAILVAGGMEGWRWNRVVRNPAFGLTVLLIVYSMITLYAERSGKLPGGDFSVYATGYQTKNAAEVIKDDAVARGRNPSELVVMAEPGFSNYFSYYLQCKTTGKMSWEGFPSARKWMAAVVTKDDALLREVCRHSEADYLVLTPANIATSSYAIYGRKALVAMPRYIGHDLLEGKTPDWLEDLTKMAHTDSRGAGGSSEAEAEGLADDMRQERQGVVNSQALSKTMAGGIKVFRVKRDSLSRDGEGGGGERGEAAGRQRQQDH